jgi:hypothetical protein
MSPEHELKEIYALQHRILRIEAALTRADIALDEPEVVEPEVEEIPIVEVDPESLVWAWIGRCWSVPVTFKCRCGKEAYQHQLIPSNEQNGASQVLTCSCGLKSQAAIWRKGR